VLEHVRDGRSNGAIARELGMSTNGVKFQVSNLLTKLACTNRREFAAWRGGGLEMIERSEIGSGEERNVRFPDEMSIGTAYVRDLGPADRPEPYWRVRHAFGHWQEVGPAQGEIRVPAKHELGLQLGESTWDHPSLLSLGPDDVQVVINGHDGAARVDLAPIAHWRSLRQLVLGGIGRLADEDLEPLGSLGALHHVLIATLGGTITTGFAPLLRLPRLRDVCLVDLSGLEPKGAGEPNGLRLEPRALRALANVPALHTLSLINVQVERMALAELRSARELRQLCVTNHAASDIDTLLEPVTGLPLPVLSFEGCRHLSDATLERIAAAHADRPLVALELQHTSISDAGIRRLLQRIDPDDLRSLWVGGTALGAASLPGIGSLTRLEQLDLRDVPVEDAGLRELAGLRHLRDLSLARTSIGPDSIEVLAGFQSLQTLDLSGTALDATALARLQELLPDCDVVQGHESWLVAGAMRQFGHSAE